MTTDCRPLEVHPTARSLTVVAHLPGVRGEDVRIGLTRYELPVDAESADGPLHSVLLLASRVDDRTAIMHLVGGVLRMHLPALPV